MLGRTIIKKNLLTKIWKTSIIKIEDYAFEDCIKLGDIKISNNLTSIGKNIFSHCKGPIICSPDSEIHKYLETNHIAYILLGAFVLNRSDVY